MHRLRCSGIFLYLVTLTFQVDLLLKKIVLGYDFWIRGVIYCCYFYTPVFRRDVLWYGDVRPGLPPGLRPSVRLSVRPFSALFSYMLWHIELKFCTWLCFDVLQIKFDCRHFASIFEGVMPLCELRIKVMCSFPHFSPTCFDILSSNFAYDFVSPYYRSSSSAVNLR